MSKSMEEANFFNKVQPVVSGITIFDFDFMKFDLDFSGIYVFDIPIDLDIILLFEPVQYLQGTILLDYSN